MTFPGYIARLSIVFHRTGRFAAVLFAVVVTIGAAEFPPVQNQQTDQAAVEPVLTRLEVNEFKPSSIRRDQVATADVIVMFQTPGPAPITGELRSFVAKRFSKFIVMINPIALPDPIILNPINIKSSTDESGSFIYAESQISIRGDVISSIGSFLGEQLTISVVDVDSSIRSRSVILEISGIGSFEKLVMYSTLAGALLTLFLTLVYIRLRRNRLEQEMVRQREVDIASRAHRVKNWLESASSEAAEDASPSVAVPQVPQALLDALARGTAVLGVGADLAVKAGLPTWRESIVAISEEFSNSIPSGLKRTIAEVVRKDPDINQVSNLFDALLTVVPREKLISEIRSFWKGMTPDLGLHRKLARLNWSGVLSFTFSDIGEDVFSEAFSKSAGPSKQNIVLTPQEGSALRDALTEKRPFYLRVLGNIDEGNLSLTLAEYRQNLQLAPEYARQIALMLDTRCFFFVGISLPTLKEYLQSINSPLQPGGSRHFALVPYSSDNELSAASLARFGVEVLQYVETIADDRAVDGFVDELLAKQPKPVDSNPSAVGTTSIDREFASQRIQQIELQNIGPFRQLLVDFTTDGSARGMAEAWTVVMGQNGVGKSVIVRAIAIALTANEEKVQRCAGSLLREGAGSGRIVLSYGKQTLEVNMVRDRGIRVVTRQVSPVEAGQALVLGFPSLRGAPAPEPGGPRPMVGRPPEPADVTPLILGDVDPRMADFKQWVVNVLSQAALGSAKAAAIRKLLDQIVADLVPGDFVGFADLDDRTMLRLQKEDRTEETIAFSSVSQGMSSIFNWIGVLTQRLYDIYNLEDNPQLGPAIVLIDEIDVHLHPDWQRRLVSLTKRFFPNVQVIASTHSALIASSLYAKEIRFVERAANGDAAVRKPAQETYGRSADQIMQSDLVGLRNARPAEVEELITEYLTLHNLLNRSPDQDKRFIELGRQLAKVQWSGAEAASGRTVPELSSDAIAEFRNSYKRQSG